ncbi:MAG: seryl-tRNA synthetase, partial [Alphaproteobacteria bacterium]|nr:seryl-tRNA synthetase [Alphaproteobacteria bacterium]
MHDIKWIRENPAEFDRGLQRRNLPPQSKELLQLDERRRAAIAQFEQAQARRNAASKDIGEAKKNKDEAAAKKLMVEVAELKETLGQLEASAKAAEEELNKVLATIPNLPAADAPDGKDEKDNVQKSEWGAKRAYAFKPRQHFDLGEALGQMDFETAAKISGARFVVLKKGLARMERALGQFMLDLHTTEHGYTEVNPPLLVRDETMFGTAQLPKFAQDQFDFDTAPFEELMERVKSRAPERIAAVQAEHVKSFKREMTTEELLASFIDGLKTGMPEYRKMYEAETGHAAHL